MRKRVQVGGGVNATIETLENRRLLSIAVGLTERNQIVTFDTDAPQVILQTTKIRGLARRDSLVGIDFRPSNGVLYGVGRNSRLYTIDAATGRASLVSSSPFATLTGEQFGVDFDPVSDRLRLVSGADQNLEINPDDGTATAQTNIVYAPGDVAAGIDPNIVALAYRSNTAGATATAAYAIDTQTNSLVRLGSSDGTTTPPSSGQLFTIGSTGFDPLAISGFDVLTDAELGNIGFAAFTVDERQPSQLFNVNLTVGTSTLVGEIGRRRQQQVTDIAIAPRGLDVVGVNRRNELVRFNTAVPHVLTSSERIEGIPRRERVLAVDVQETTGDLFAFTSGNRLYNIDIATRTASAVGAVSSVELSRRAAYAMDFNPLTGELRVVNSADQNVRFDPTTGNAIDFDPTAEGVQGDIGLTFIANDPRQGANPNVMALAYSGTVTGTETTAFAIDSTQNSLVRLGSPNANPISPDNGQLSTIGNLGVNIGDTGGFDIRQIDGVDRTLAVFTTNNRRDGLYTIDLTTGTATFIGGLARQAKGLVDLAIVGE